MSGIERRKSRRYAVNIEIDWEVSLGRQKGTISDLSFLGCFVLCSGEVDDGETVTLIFPLEGSKNVEIPAIVVNHVYEIGFGVKFTKIDESQHLLLHTILAEAASKRK